MSLNLSEIRKEKRTITVEFGEESFDVTYLPNVITPEVEDEIVAQGDEGGSQRLREQLCAVVDDWDVKVSEKGKKVPLTPDDVKQVPYSVIGAVMQAVVEDQQGNR